MRAFKLSFCASASLAIVRWSCGSRRSDKASGIRFLRGFTTLYAEFQVVVNRIMECLDDLRNSIALESDQIAKSDYSTIEGSLFLIQLYEARVVFVFHCNNSSLTLTQLITQIKIYRRSWYWFCSRRDSSGSQPIAQISYHEFPHFLLWMGSMQNGPGATEGYPNA